MNTILKGSISHFPKKKKKKNCKGIILVCDKNNEQSVTGKFFLSTFFFFDFIFIKFFFLHFFFFLFFFLKKIMKNVDLDYWEEDAIINCPVGVQFVVICNKIDVEAEGKEDWRERSREWSQKKNYSFFECSAKTSDNLECAFKKMVQLVIENSPILFEPQKENEKVKIEVPPKKQTSCCN